MRKVFFIFISVFILFSTVLYAEIPTQNSVTKLYVATFNRAPDATGLDYWLNDSGLILEQIAQSFFDQAETNVLYPSTISNRDFIKAVYRNLFNREPDTGGWDYWENELNSGRVPKSVFILAVINGAQNTIEYGEDATILNNKMAVGILYAQSGLNDVQWAKDVMANVTANVLSIDQAEDMIEDLILSLIPKKPTANPMYGIIDGGLMVTLSQADAADIYYWIDDNTSGTEQPYIAPITLNLNDMNNTELILYVFARVTIDGVNYDSDIAEFLYTACATGKVLNEYKVCVAAPTTKEIYTFADWELKCPPSLYYQVHDYYGDEEHACHIDESSDSLRYTLLRKNYNDDGKIEDIGYYVIFYNDDHEVENRIVKQLNYDYYYTNGDLQNEYISSIRKNLDGTWTSLQDSVKGWNPTNKFEAFYTHKLNSGNGTWESLMKSRRDWNTDNILIEESIYFDPLLHYNPDYGYALWNPIYTHKRWYEDGVLAYEQRFQSVEDPDRWRSVMVFNNSYYASGNKNTLYENHFIVKQQPGGHWYSFVLLYETWSDIPSRKIVERAYSLGQEFDGTWRSYGTRTTRWLYDDHPNQKTNETIMELYTNTDNRLDVRTVSIISWWEDGTIRDQWP